MESVAGTDRPTVLVVDDEAYVRNLLARWLRDAGYDCIAAQSCDEAWAQLELNEIAVATLDISIPGGSGLDLLKRIRERYSDTSVIMLTGEVAAPKVIEALTGGACGYLIKPIDRDELLLHVRQGLERRSLILEGRQYTLQLEDRARDQAREVHRACEETIHRLASACTYRDVETGAHAKRTGLLSELLARAAGWGPVETERLRLAAPMHDIGKIGIPDKILQKPGRLTLDEFEIMKQHTAIGAEILAGSDSVVLQMAQVIALCHHEKWNGHGYPAGLSGTEIPEVARIVAIVDVYDALTHPRIYRPALSEAEAIAMMVEKSGSHFDPDLLEVFLSYLPEMRQISEGCLDVLTPRSLIKMAFRDEVAHEALAR